MSVSVSDIKENLKCALDCIKKRDYNGGIKHCKLVLRLDAHNYNALIFSGSCYHEMGKGQQAVEVLKQAIQINPHQITAWQGIVKHYEKNGPKNHPDLIEAYKKISLFYEKDDVNKYIENTLKMVGILMSQNDYEPALRVVNRLFKTHNFVNLEMATISVQIFLKLKDIKPEHLDLYEASLKVLIEKKPTEDYIKRYLYLLYKNKKFDRLVSECISMERFFNLFYSPLDWLCRIYLEQDDEKMNQLVNGKIESYVEKLFKLHPTSKFGYFALGKYQFLQKDYLGAISSLSLALESSFNLLGIEILIKIFMNVWDFFRATEYSTYAISKINKEDTANLKTFTHYLIQAKIGLVFTDSVGINQNELLSELDLFLKNFQISEEEDSQMLYFKAKYYVLTNNWEKLNETLSKIENLNVYNPHNWEIDLYCLLLKYHESKEDFELFVSSQCELDQENFELFCHAGLLFWRLKEYSTCAKFFIKASQISNNHPVPFTFLGKLFNIQGDFENAEKFLSKSHKIYESSEVASILSDIYTETGNFERNKEILISATKMTEKEGKWAWFRLGLLYMKNEKYINDAVDAFQKTLKFDYNDPNICESLADAYFKRGSYRAAINAYKQAVKLGAEETHINFKIGRVFTHLRQYPEAIEIFKSVDESFTHVFTELASSYYYIAKNYLTENLDKSCILAVNEGIKYAAKAIKANNKSLIGWTIAGELAILVGVLPSKTTFEIPSFLINGSDTNETETVPLQIFLSLSIKCFQQAIQLSSILDSVSKEIESYLWNCLSKSFYKIANLNFGKEKDFLNNSLIGAKNSIVISQGNYVYWNHLGIVAQQLKLYPLAQHSFIKSIEIEPQNVEGWCNLGLLYLILKAPILAHKCYRKAQTLDPRFSCAWIGQGLVAEKLEPQEAMDLFRHASQMDSTHSIAIIAFAEWLCKFLENLKSFNAEDYNYFIIKLDGINTCLTLLSRYVERYPKSLPALNFKGIMAARLNLFLTAEESFTLATDLLKEDDDEIHDILYLNLALTKISLEKYNEALLCLNKIKQSNFEAKSAEAYATFKNGKLKECLVLYQELKMYNDINEEKKGCVLIALGLISIINQDITQAKTYLFECSKSYNSVQALLSLCSLALLNNESNLIIGTLQKLNAHSENIKYIHDIAFMKACGDFFRGREGKSRYQFTRELHKYPFEPKLWTGLVYNLINNLGSDENFDDASAIRICIQNSIKLSASTKMNEDLCLIAYSYLIENDWRKAIIFAQKAIKLGPHLPKNWAVLACSLYLKSAENESQNDLQLAYNIGKSLIDNPTIKQTKLLEWVENFQNICASQM